MAKSLLLVLLVVVVVAHASATVRKTCVWSEDKSAFVQDKDSRDEVVVELPAIDKDTIFFFLSITVNHTLEDGGNVESNYSFLASPASLIGRLSPPLMEALSMNALHLLSRTNFTEITVTLPPAVCSELSKDAMIQMVRSTLRRAGIVESTGWVITTHAKSKNSLGSSQVMLFMSDGLMSIINTFIAEPFLLLILTRVISRYHREMSNVRTTTLFIHSAMITCGMIVPAFMVYWGYTSYHYYATDRIAALLFPDKLLAPYTIHLIFYTLTVFTSFFGGLFFTKCSLSTSTRQSRFSCVERFGFGLISVVLSMITYHLFFVILSVFIDTMSTVQFLIQFVAVLTLMLLAVASVIQQYRKTQLRGFFILVVTLHAIIFVLYSISLTTFQDLILGDSKVASSASLAVVLALSLLAVSVSYSILSLILKPHKCGQQDASDGTRRDVESGRVKSLVPHFPMSKAEQFQLLMMLPTFMATWKSRKSDKDSKAKSTMSCKENEEEKV